ncbi:hypothetical protein LXL04_009838 [Taraxacum kok-saghyz]
MKLQSRKVNASRLIPKLSQSQLTTHEYRPSPTSRLPFFTAPIPPAPAGQRLRQSSFTSGSAQASTSVDFSLQLQNDSRFPAQDYSFLYMGRLLEGFGVGVISYTVNLSLPYFNISYSLLSVTIGILLAYLMGLFLPWRVPAVIGTLPCIFLIPGLFFIPESPRWSAKMGFIEDCETSLQVLRGFDSDISSEFNEIKNMLKDTKPFSDVQLDERVNTWMKTFGEKYLK